MYPRLSSCIYWTVETFGSDFCVRLCTLNIGVSIFLMGRQLCSWFIVENLYYYQIMRVFLICDAWWAETFFLGNSLQIFELCFMSFSHSNDLCNDLALIATYYSFYECPVMHRVFFFRIIWLQWSILRQRSRCTSPHFWCKKITVADKISSLL